LRRLIHLNVAHNIFIILGTSSSDDANEEEDETEFTRVIINPRDKVVKEFQIKDSETVILWKFKTESYDVGFQVTYSDPKSEANIPETDIIPYSRLNAHEALQQGSHVCQKPGVFTIVFDNSYSMMKSKTLLYKISLGDSDSSEFQECPEF
jgi:hypothetical protein